MSTPVFRSPLDESPTDEWVEDDDSSTGGTARSLPNSDERYFRRDKRGMVKLRMNLSPEEATLIEEAADGTPLMVYIHRTLISQSKRHIKSRDDH